MTILNLVIAGAAQALHADSDHGRSVELVKKDDRRATCDCWHKASVAVPGFVAGLNQVRLQVVPEADLNFILARYKDGNTNNDMPSQRAMARIGLGILG